jgi:GMP synthase (glutamine-hydrolysing)
VLIVDFGAQYTQLIARRVREAGVYSVIVPFDQAEAALQSDPPKAIILSGGPASVHETGTPQAASALFNAGVPVLGICYGEQAMVAALGGVVEGGHEREFGRAELQIIDDTPLFDGGFQVGERAPVWMSHGDRVTRLPPGFRAVGISTGAPFAAIADDSRRLYGVQFHPEVVHTPKGAALLANFVRAIAGCAGDWTMAQFRASEVARIRAQVGSERVICGLSGGVDSTVAALLIHEAIGDQLTCIFVDTGLMRAGEAEEVVGGCELALACTIRVASSNARFGFPEVKLGLLPGYGGTQRLARQVGRGRALHMMLTGEPIDAAEALDCGLVTRVCAPEELDTVVSELAGRLAQSAPLAMRAIIQSVNAGADLPLEEGLAIETAEFVEICSTQDMREGTAAFLEKHRPDFQGR